MSSRQPAWDVAPTIRGDRTVRVTRWTCAKCDARHERVITSATPPPAEAVVKWAMRDGWRVDAYRRSAIRCPACQAGATIHHLDQSPPEQEIAPVSSTVTATAAPKPPLTPREPTQAERLKIRAVLDKHFDDGAGCWLDGFSDQKAGEACAVPWSLVTRIREAAYGPIRVDPEVAALRADMVQIARDIVALNDRHAAAVKRLDALGAKRAA